jgi:hypothetical protein
MLLTQLGKTRQNLTSNPADSSRRFRLKRESSDANSNVFVI